MFLDQKKKILKIYFIYRLVNDLIKDEMTQIHAFSQKTYTPDEWAKKQEKEGKNPETKIPNVCLGGCANDKK